MFVLTYNGIQYQYHTHVKLVAKLGGIKAINAKLQTPLMYGEQYYLKHIVHIANQFKDKLNANFG